jgi:hypothetical protein
MSSFEMCAYFVSQNPISHEGKTVNDVDHSTSTEDIQNFKILSKPNPDQQCSKGTQEGPKTKKFLLDEGIIATLVCTKNNIH